MKSLLYIIIMILLMACSTKTRVIEVPVETVRSEYIHNIKYDSVFVHDSIDRYIRGDTVFIYKEKTRFKYINKVDTVVSTDTIPKIIKIETEKVVEVNHIKWYQKSLMWVGSIMSLISISYIIYKVKIK